MLRNRLVLALVAAAACSDSGGGGAGPPFTGETGTILFVTQVPISGFGTVSSTFGNHLPGIGEAPRGGALMLRYPDGTLRNLTLEAGYGSDGLQGEKAIAVREPAVHFSGNKAIFAMVIGAPTRQYEVKSYRWQLYEVTGLGRGETAVITRVAGQPEEFNNVAPTYAPDDSILFTTDRPRSGAQHHYPQRDEYESSPTVSGLWRLAGTNLTLLSHAPSGVFSPSVDSAGRVLFIKWDHLQRDQQADADRVGGTHGSFTYADESEGASKIGSLDGMEVFPEARDPCDPDARANVELHRFNQFFPWQINLDGTGEETLNHVGRHELGGSYAEGSFKDDSNLSYFAPETTHANRFYLSGDGGMLQLREDGATPGRFYATAAREFGPAASGTLFRFDGGPAVNPEDMVLTPLTDPASGHYRDPLGMSDGTLIAAHASETREIDQHPYAFRLRVLQKDGEGYTPGPPLTGGISAKLSWWSPDQILTYEGDLWELDPVEVHARPRPTPSTYGMEAPEQKIFSDEGVSPDELRGWLRDNDLALIVSRDVTTRDRADVFQPYNLRVPSGVMTAPKPGKIYDVSGLQLFQAEALRGYGGMASPSPGRRLLARPLHGDKVSSQVTIARDGSTAAFVPARRALSWQLVGPDGGAVVRERNWVTFAPGEIRVCASCHGVNKMNQAGAPPPTNPPEALRLLVRGWKKARP